MLPVATWCTWRLVIASGLRGAYYPHSLILDDFHYPLSSVATSLAMMVAEIVDIDVLLNRGNPSSVWCREYRIAALRMGIDGGVAAEYRVMPSQTPTTSLVRALTLVA